MSQGKKLSLEDRIAAAFLPGIRSHEVSALMREVEAASLAVGEAADRAKERALEPTLSSANVASARAEMEDAAFKRDRMRTALARLDERLQELEAQEEQERRWEVYKKATAERDALAAELKDVYPAFEARIADLLARIEASDREITRINGRAKPDGASPILGAEELARGLGGYSVGVSNIPRITRDLRLPAFQYRPLGEYAWPRSR